MKNMKCKKMLASMIAVVMLTLVWMPLCLAAEPAPTNQAHVILDGTPVDFGDTYAMLLENYTFVPIAKIIELLTGKTPDWDSANKMASFEFNGKTYKIYQQYKGIYVNDTFQKFDTNPKIVNNRTMIPLRMMTDALGFKIEWNGISRTVTITSPGGVSSASAFDIITVYPRSVEAAPGTEISVEVTGNAGAAAAKIVDENGNTVATSDIFMLSATSTNKEFTLKFTPEYEGRYRAHVMNAAGAVAERSLPLEIVYASGAAITDIRLSSDGVVLDDYVTLTVRTSPETARVRLESEYSSDVIESSNYVTSGDEREFTFDWRIRSSYYSNVSSVNAKVFAIGSNGKQGGSRAISVRIDKDAPVISEVNASPKDIGYDSDSKITVTTNTNVSGVMFEIISGSGSLYRSSMSSCTSESGSKKYWENTFTSRDQTGEVKILITAVSPSGTRKEQTLTLSVSSSGSTSGSGTIYTIYSNNIVQTPSIASTDQTIHFEVRTSANVYLLRYIYNGQEMTTTNMGSGYWEFNLTHDSVAYNPRTVTLIAYNENFEIKSTATYTINMY